MRRRVTFQQSLITNLVPALLVLGLAMALVASAGARAAIGEMARSITTVAAAYAGDGVRRFFDPVRANVTLVEDLVRAGRIDVDEAEGLLSLVAPVLETTPQIASVQVADQTGREAMLRRTEGGWVVRLTDAERAGAGAAIVDERGTQRREPIAYDARTRPWFAGAVARLDRHGADAEPAKRTHWTEPYTFFTLREPGITVSRSLRGADGRLIVVAIDVRLRDLSDATRGIRVSENGGVAAVSGGGRLIGLPAQAAEGDLLRTPEDAGLRVLADTARAFTPRGATLPETGSSRRFFSDGRAYWGRIEGFELGDGGRLWLGIWLPEVDLFGDLPTLRSVVVAVLVLVLLVGVLRAVWLAREYGRPVSALVALSERISRLDLDDPGPVQTNLAELDRLARAHERMRLSLRQLLRLERDLQVARQIQQATFPARIPDVPRVSIAAWGEPADETGGDTYDIIGVSGIGEGAYHPDDRHPDGALLLLADATGHGVGPALSVTQLRSMMRMAVRGGTPLVEIPGHMNAQLREDLTEGRFITAWFGLVQGRSGVVRGLSCGQGPLVVFRAGGGGGEAFPADLPPLGVVDGLEAVEPHRIELEPGDVFLAASDGIFEAKNAVGEVFGVERVFASLERSSGADARVVLDTLRGDLARFMGGTPHKDDCTALVIRRS